MIEFIWKDRAEEIYKQCRDTYNFKVNKKFYDYLISLNLPCNYFDAVPYWIAFQVRKDMLEKDEDCTMAVVGYEGKGKSTFSAQFCSIVSPKTFRMKSFCFNFLDFLRVSEDCNYGDSIQLDEGAMFLYNRERLKDSNIGVTKLFMLNRQDNLHYQIDIPDFFDLDPYFRQHRVKYLIKITSKGRYKLIKKKGIEIINLLGKSKQNRLKLPSNLFHTGYFTKNFPKINDISHQAYKDIKRKHKQEYKAELKKIYEENINKETEESLYISLTDFLSKIPLNRDTALKLIHKGEIKAKKIGNKWWILREMLDYGVKSAD